MQPADRESVFWVPSLQPEAVLLSAVSSAGGSAAAPVDLTHLPGLDLRRADDGWHGVWRAGGIDHQFWLVQEPSDTAAAYTLTLPFDALFELRAHAARRLRRALNGRSPGRPFRAMPDQLREFHILTLRALDARQRGESYRTIAETLLGFRGTKTDWESDPRKNKARRLVASGQRMMRGGYRTLLHYPIKLPAVSTLADPSEATFAFRGAVSAGAQIRHAPSHLFSATVSHDALSPPTASDPLNRR